MKKKKQKNIGIEVKFPEKECNDINCPFHGKLRIRGREFTGEVKRVKAQRTAVIEWQRLYYLPKYERYEKRRSRIITHLPSCLNVKLGDQVRIVECKPLSKTKSSVIIEVLK